MMEPWDGPAAVLFSDGELVGAVLDRNGLRPTRYYLLDTNTILLSSEVGVLDIPPERIVRKSRLMDCGVPFCQAGITFGGQRLGCPLHNLIPEWNDLVWTGNRERALSRLLKTNCFPEFTGRVCPALCEKACICGMRKDEGDEVEKAFSKWDINFIRVNAEERFLSKLAGVTEPERKRKIIGEEFIRVFEAEAKKIGRVDYLVQGTIYPDVIESGLGNSAVIKSHHNVGGLPDYVDFKEIIEPLRMLFKDEVRQLGRELELPEYLVMQKLSDIVSPAAVLFTGGTAPPSCHSFCTKSMFFATLGQGKVSLFY